MLRRYSDQPMLQEDTARVSAEHGRKVALYSRFVSRLLRATHRNDFRRGRSIRARDLIDSAMGATRAKRLRTRLERLVQFVKDTFSLSRKLHKFRTTTSFSPLNGDGSASRRGRHA